MGFGLDETNCHRLNFAQVVSKSREHYETGTSQDLCLAYRMTASERWHASLRICGMVPIDLLWRVLEDAQVEPRPNLMFLRQFGLPR